jgi:hypothetical protein
MFRYKLIIGRDLRVWTLSAQKTEPGIAVGTLITERPPHRSVRAEFPHTAPTSGV